MSLKVISYNILADKWAIYREEDKTTHKLQFRYEYVENKDFVLNWEHRLPRIIDKIKSYDPDIICLQEVELRNVEEDFIKHFPEYNNYHHDICKKRTNDIGNLCFWKKDKLSATEKSFNSCAVFIKFTINDLEFLLINLHLKAGLNSVECIATRVNQIRSCIKTVTNIPICICGDFNEQLDDTAVSKELIAKQFIISSLQITCNVYNYEKKEQNYYAFDHVVFRDLNVIVEPCPEAEPLPTINQPSDHFPLLFTITL